MILQVPPGTRTYQLQNSIIWMDDEGISYSVPTSDRYILRSKESAIAEIDLLKKINGGGKVFMIMEMHPDTQPISKKDRESINELVEDLFGALAIISKSSFHTMIVRLLFSFKAPVFPQAIFNSESEARDWIRKCMKNRG